MRAGGGGTEERDGGELPGAVRCAGACTAAPVGDWRRAACERGWHTGGRRRSGGAGRTCCARTSPSTRRSSPRARRATSSTPSRACRCGTPGSTTGTVASQRPTPKSPKDRKPEPQPRAPHTKQTRAAPRCGPRGERGGTAPADRRVVVTGALVRMRSLAAVGAGRRDGARRRRVPERARGPARDELAAAGE
jgi:hypothetical protein